MSEENKISVLYVDDEEPNLSAFRANFRRDFDVHLARSGKEALEIVETTPLQVIISDQRMPEMTGVEFLEKVRSSHPDPIRMLLTGFADIEAVVNAINKGGVHSYLTKPWDENDLRVQIQNAYEIFDLRDRNRKLFNQYEQVFRGSSDPIFIVSRNGEVVDFNQATAELFKYSKKELKQTNFLDLIETEDFGSKVKAALSSSGEIKNMEFTFHNSEGDLIDCIISAKRISSNSGTKDHFQGILKDITERKKEELRMKRLNEDLEKRVQYRTRQLKEAMKDLGSFSYTVAHDLRSPLKSSMAMITLLDEQLQGQLDEHGKELIDRIDGSSHKMLRLVDDLLEFSQMNKTQMDLTSVDLNEVVPRVVRDLSTEQQKQNVTVDIQPLPKIKSDESLISVVFTNLISNAFKFTKNSESPKVTIASKEDDDGFEIWVKDNGVGFDPRRADRVFGAFKRLHRSDEFEGSGIGLAIVDRIIRKHGGSVRAESALGEGATIFMRFPKKFDAPEPLPF